MCHSSSQKAAPNQNVQKIEQLHEETIEDQNSIIELQAEAKGTQERGDSWSDFQSAVQEGLKSVKTMTVSEIKSRELLIHLDWLCSTIRS